MKHGLHISCKLSPPPILVKIANYSKYTIILLVNKLQFFVFERNQCKFCCSLYLTFIFIQSCRTSQDLSIHPPVAPCGERRGLYIRCRLPARAVDLQTRETQVSAGEGERDAPLPHGEDHLGRKYRTCRVLLWRRYY